MALVEIKINEAKRIALINAQSQYSLKIKIMLSYPSARVTPIKLELFKILIVVCLFRFDKLET